MLVVVATPRDWFPAFAVLPRWSCSSSSRSARVPAGYLAQADGRRGAVRAVRAAGAVRRHRPADRGARRLASPSRACSAAWGLLAKGTLGVLACSPWPPPPSRVDLLAGLRAAADARPARADHGLHDPLPRRGHRRDGPDASSACESRGCDPRSPRHWPVLARSLGALFIRSYERGERVHLAMLSRGYTGTLPDAATTTGRPAERLMSHPRPRRPRAGATPTPTGTRRCSASTCTSTAGERVALLGPNGAGKTTLVLHLNGILTAGRRHASRSPGCRSTKENLAGDPAPGRHRLPGPRRPAVHGARSARTSRSGRPTSGCAGAELERRVDRRARPGRDGRLRRPPAAPPLLRPAAPGRGRHGARDGARDPGARRAVVQPRPGLPPRAGRHPPRRST